MDRLLRLMKKHEDILSGTQGNLCTRIIEIIATLFLGCLIKQAIGV